MFVQDRSGVCPVSIPRLCVDPGSTPGRDGSMPDRLSRADRRLHAHPDRLGVIDPDRLMDRLPNAGRRRIESLLILYRPLGSFPDRSGWTAVDRPICVDLASLAPIRVMSGVGPGSSRGRPEVDPVGNRRSVRDRPGSIRTDSGLTLGRLWVDPRSTGGRPAVAGRPGIDRNGSSAIELGSTCNRESSRDRQGSLPV